MKNKYESPAYAELLPLRETSRLLEGLTDEELRILADAGCMHHHPVGSILFKQGEPAELLSMVTSGAVIFYRVTPTGRRSMLDLAEPGEVVGSQSLAGGQHIFTAEAIAESTTLAWEAKAVERLVLSSPRLAANALRQAVERMFELSETVSELITGSAEQRLAGVLLRLCAKFGERRLKSIRITGLSEEEIALMAGLSLYTANRILSRWGKQRVIRTGRRQLEIRDPSRLARIAGKLPAVVGVLLTNLVPTLGCGFPFA